MGVQYCTSLVCPLLVLVSDLFTGHDLTICFSKVVYVQRYCSRGGIYRNEKLINFLNRCRQQTTKDGGLGSSLPQPHQSLLLGSRRFGEGQNSFTLVT